VRVWRGYKVSTFITAGIAALTKVACLYNGTAGRIARVRAITAIGNGASAAQFSLERHVGALTAGTPIVPTADDPNEAIAASCVFRGATASDGGGAVAITLSGASGPWAARIQQRGNGNERMINSPIVVPTDYALTVWQLATTPDLLMVTFEFEEAQV